jgi:hypothetical protein
MSIILLMAVPVRLTRSLEAIMALSVVANHHLLRASTPDHYDLGQFSVPSSPNEMPATVLQKSDLVDTDWRGGKEGKLTDMAPVSGTRTLH